MIIAVVGAGGKTTLIKKLAKEYLQQGKRVFVTTSTHMYREEDTLVTDDAKAIIEALEKKKYCFAGRAAEDMKKETLPQGKRQTIKKEFAEKIIALSKETYQKVCGYADVVLIEADGSKQLPLKFPRKGEPVIYDNVEEIVVVYGLHGIGKNVKEVVHRWELAKKCFTKGQDWGGKWNTLETENRTSEMWEEEDIVTPNHIWFLVQKGYIEPLRKQYPDKKIKLYGSHEKTLYERVIASIINSAGDFGEEIQKIGENISQKNSKIAYAISKIEKEWFCPKPKLIILGGGHVSVALAKMASALDFQVKVMDDREEFANRERFPDAWEVICDSFVNLEAYLEPDAYYVVVTRGHKDDFECVKKILPTKYTYLGMIGSHLKVTKTFENLKNEGFTEEQLDTIFAPIGLQIHAVTPAEIAISILAQIIQEKNKKQVSSVSAELLSCKDAGVLCIIIEKTGSSPRGVGSMMLVTKDSVIDSIGGGAVEFAAIQDARQCQEVFVKEYHLNSKDSEKLGMICGGSNKVLFVPI
ncbi:MAG: putative selenium-dependent hydroxylase accessory protein YqeC [Lachnospiraceae bacterium]|nr:putative selenium-dependent hydroxylase accessory protein YqeC [Lachnospiraceae bacterium]